MRGKYERFRGELYRDGGAVTGEMRRSGQFWLLFALFIAVEAGLLPIEQPFATTGERVQQYAARTISTDNCVLRCFLQIRAILDREETTSCWRLCIM